MVRAPLRRGAGTRPEKPSRVARAFKRAFDVVASLGALAAFAPLGALIAAAVTLDSRGPVFFRQERTGRGGKPFFILKFRTMVRNAAAIGPGITGAGDPRITKVGQLLRVTKLDELPNIVNVLKGEMSVVGPRPDLPRFMTVLTPDQRRILAFRPGLTGPTQIRYIAEEEMLSPINIDDNYVENVFRDKIASDLTYIENWSLGRDFVLILYTPVALLFKVFGRLTRTFKPRPAAPPPK